MGCSLSWRCVGLLLGLMGCVNQALPARSLPATDPRAMVIRLLEDGIGRADPEVIRPLIGERYRQHNPRVPDGPEGLLGFVSEFQKLPAARRPQVRVQRVFLDGELVFAHTLYRRRSDVAGFDVFKVQDGKLVEHWDAGQSEPQPRKSAHGMLDGPVVASELAQTAANKKLVNGFVTQVLIERQLDAMELYFEGDGCVQHDPQLADGMHAWRAALAESQLARHEALVRLMGEGDFVLAQSRGRRGDDVVVLYDLFRTARGKIAEHWSVVEAVPARAANENGMF